MDNKRKGLIAAADVLETACAIDGSALVAAGGSGIITDVEQAALDALREACSIAGLYLADFDVPRLGGFVEIRSVISFATATGGEDGGKG